MAKNTMDDMLKRIDEMRGFFKIGDEVIPFLSDLFNFLKDVMPLMSEVNTSLKDGAGKLPTAQDRLSDVNEATEMATTEIMDKLDHINNDVNNLRKQVDDEGNATIDRVESTTMEIIFALQFQDITSQKLEHATRILNAIHEKFGSLFSQIEQMRVNSAFGNQAIQALSEQENTDDAKSRREKFDEETEDKIREEQISQDDIDSLFS